MLRILAVGVTGLLVLCSGCNNGQEEEVRQRADNFEAAVHGRDWTQACKQLAPTTRDELAQSGGGSCAKGLANETLEAPGSAHKVKVFGTTAQVHYAHDTLFLGRFADGWRVIAAGCTPHRNEPYACVVQGG